MKPTVLLDCDGVLSDFVQGVLWEASRVTGLDYFRSQITRYSVLDCLNLSVHERMLIESKIKQQSFCLALPVLPDAVTGVQLLRSHAEIQILTAPYPFAPFWPYERARWLDKHFGVPQERIILAHQKQLVQGDMLIDDNPDHINSWVEKNQGQAVLWAQPYNSLAQITQPELVIRTSNWRDAVNFLNSGVL